METTQGKVRTVLLLSIIASWNIDKVFIYVFADNEPRSAAQSQSFALSYGVEPISFVSADPFSCLHFNDGSFFLAQKAAKEVIIIDFS